MTHTTAKTWGKLCARARTIFNTLGAKSAAGYLRNREVDFDTAYRVLFNRAPRV